MCIVFPDRSEIARRLAYLADQIGSSSNKGGWLYVAEVLIAALTDYGKDEHRHVEAYSLGADEDPQPAFSLKVKAYSLVRRRCWSISSPNR